MDLSNPATCDNSAALTALTQGGFVMMTVFIMFSHKRGNSPPPHHPRHIHHRSTPCFRGSFQLCIHRCFPTVHPQATTRLHTRVPESARPLWAADRSEDPLAATKLHESRHIYTHTSKPPSAFGPQHPGASAYLWHFDSPNTVSATWWDAVSSPSQTEQRAPSTADEARLKSYTWQLSAAVTGSCLQLAQRTPECKSSTDMSR